MTDPRIPESNVPNERVQVVDRGSSGTATVAIIAIIVLAAGAFFFYGGNFFDSDRDVDVTLQSPSVTAPQVPAAPATPEVSPQPGPAVPPAAPAPSGG